MSALAQEVSLHPLSINDLDTLMAVEERAYTYPWTRGNFTDALASGYQIQLIKGGNELIGYFVAMLGVDEAHLLNITVAPEFQRQGWALVLLNALTLWARGQGAQWLWLEVRMNNQRARHIYGQYGFREVGVRKRYYPAANGLREDAVVMSVPL